MILISPHLPPTLMGLAGGSASVTNLQNALKALSQVSGRPAIDPGVADGLVGPRTIGAIIAAIGVIGDKLPSELRYALQIGLIAGGTSTQAKDLVVRYATPLEVAVKAGILKFAAGGGPVLPVPDPGAAPAPIVVAPTPSATMTFLQTPFGMASVGVGVVGLGLLIYALVK